MRTCFLLLATIGTLSLPAQTYTGSGGPIPDDGSSIFFTCPVSGLVPSTIDTALFGVMRVCINLTHTYDSDLDISLVAPDGTTVPLTLGNGGSGNDFLNTCFEQYALESILDGSAPFNGTYRPQGQIGHVNNGQNGNGAWALLVHDTYPFADQGTLFNWSITFGNDPADYFVLTESDLPIVVINTNGQAIPDDPKVLADMGIIWNGPGVRNHLTDPFNHYSGPIGIERRGVSSSWVSKLSYGLETWDANANAIDTSLFGMPSENDWVLSAGYSDKTLMRNALVYSTARAMGHYAPRTMHVDLVLNGEYVGVYTFLEKIKRDAGRVDIAKLTATDLSGDDVTGGYIVKVDKVNGSGGGGWYSLLPPAFTPGGADVFIQYEYPGDDVIMPQQAAYIEAYVDSFELSLQSALPSDPVTGYPHFIDETSFADYLLLTELVRNGDGYRISTFYHKDKASNGGKLKAGPMWDYDLAAGNANYCDFWRTDGWAYHFGQVCSDPWLPSGWWEKLVEDPAFQRVLRCRWDELKYSVLSPSAINARVDSMANLLLESQDFNFHVWPIMGSYVWPNYYIAEDYDGEVDTLKWFLQERWNWLEAELPPVIVPCSTVGVNDHASPVVPMTAFFERDVLHVSLVTERSERLVVLDAQGRTVATARLGAGARTARIPMTGAATGLYTVLAIDTGAALRVVRSE